MAITEMSLPIDIPWKRMGVSGDMIDTKAGDLKFPKKWRSSISAFYYEPAELPPDYCDRKITYLKIVCTVTNHQISDDEWSVLNELAGTYGEFEAWKDFDATITDSFPCYGALLQVAVFPNPSAGVAVHDFPYISAFQPRKREMYEVVTESGEVASQSGNKINILKGTTNTDTTEDYDLKLGGGGGGGASYLFGAYTKQGKAEPQKQTGTIDRYQTQDQNVISADASREKRESHAYSTNINQLYTLLQGYHLGTNRALFFIQPRPHVQDTKFTFVRGLRRLEGIQEFFLIVDRPASTPGICVELALETAHLHLERAYRYRLIPLSELYAPGNLDKTAEALGINLNQFFQNHESLKKCIDIWNQKAPGIRQAVNEAQPVLPYSTPFLDRLMTDKLVTPEEIWSMASVVKDVPSIGIEEVAIIFEEYESDSGQIFITGRRLCTCMTTVGPHQGEGGIECEHSSADNISTCDGVSVVHSRPYTKGGTAMGSALIYGFSQPGDSSGQNAILDDINQTLWRSLGSTRRFAYGEVSFLETDFVLDELAQFLRLLKGAEIQDVALTKVDSMRPFLERGLGRTSGIKSILGVGTLSTRQIARDLNLAEQEARKVRRDLLMASLKALDPKTINSKARPANMIQERFIARYPQTRLRALERSARPKLQPRVQANKRQSVQQKRKK